MGVSWVFEVDVPPSQVERELIVAGAECIGIYTVDSTPYKPSESGISPFFLLHHTQYPQSAFSISLSENYKSSARASTDRGFDLILTKLSSGLQADLNGKFEVRGNELSLKDFHVRVGMATQSTGAKGTIVEVEYAPSCVASQAMPIINEFVKHFFPEIDNSFKSDVIDKKGPEPYSALETLYQYSLLFQEMRKRA